ncbi:MAG: nitroreductase [Bacillota bacterium]|nr:nitroreductase [Bacillota bacterium]
MNNEILKGIKERRSARKYKDQQITAEELQTVLEAGTYAPSGRGLQASRIVAVQDPETVAKLVKMNAAVLGTPDANPYYGAPTIVLVFSPDPADRLTAVEDGSCVLATMMLAAHSIGLGSCWIHREREMFEAEEGKALMREWGLDDTMIGVGSIALGYVEGKLPGPFPRKKDYYRIV